MSARHPARDFPGYTPELPNFRKWNPLPYAQGPKLREAKPRAHRNAAGTELGFEFGSVPSCGFSSLFYGCGS